jgi:hypothetical protein
MCVTLDDLHGLHPSRLVQRSRGKHASPAQHHIQRCPELVRDHREKLMRSVMSCPVRSIRTATPDGSRSTLPRVGKRPHGAVGPHDAVLHLIPLAGLHGMRDDSHQIGAIVRMQAFAK